MLHYIDQNDQLILGKYRPINKEIKQDVTTYVKSRYLKSLLPCLLHAHALVNWSNKNYVNWQKINRKFSFRTEV